MDCAKGTHQFSKGLQFMIKDLTTGRPAHVLWRFSLPLLGSILFQQLYNVADSFVAGKFIGDDALGAVGNAYEVTLIYLAFTFGCNVGCSVIVSQLFGGKRYRELKTAVSTCFITSTVICLVLTLAGFLGIPYLLDVIRVPEHILPDVVDYLDIYTLGLLFQFVYNISTGVFSALGDSKTPFVFLAVSSVSNIFVDILFVLWGGGVKGVAWATFLCQGVSAVLAFVTILRRLKKIECEGKAELFSVPLLCKFLKIAVPSTLQQSFVSVGNMFIQSIVNNSGMLVIAGYSAVIKLQNLAITCLSTLGNAMSSFTAQNMGANKPERVREGFRACLRMGLALALCLSALYLTAGPYLIDIFRSADSAEGVVDVGMRFVRIVAPFYIVVTMKLIADGVLRGAGAMGHYMTATFADLLLRVVLAFLFSSLWGEVGIWTAWPVGWAIAAVLSLVFYFSGVWKKSMI